MEPTSVGNIILPIVKMVAGQPGDKLTNVIKANVEQGVQRLKGLAPILSKLVNAGELKIVGGTYQLSTGKIDVFS